MSLELYERNAKNKKWKCVFGSYKIVESCWEVVDLQIAGLSGMGVTV